MAESPQWELLYWPSMVGRGEMVKLIFEDQGVPYSLPMQQAEPTTPPALVKFLLGQDGTLPHVLAPPILRRGDFIMYQAPAILRYLGKELGLLPDSPEDQVYADCLMETVADLIAEGHDAWHPIERSKGFAEQQKEAEEHFIPIYKKTRLPKFSAFFEKVLERANKGKDSVYLFGDKFTYVDIALFHTYHGIRFQCPDEYKSMDIPRIRALVEAVEKRPNIAAYLASERRFAYSNSGPTF
uniref:Glutathione S-transferase n=1 Tax=Palpitomonas bilix TaxID=652834 RepID=A0A7S3D2J3_9EUKA|mmetsp:Transcript_19482/g.49910  ORF Transcript_19482/g.49910 Transcript_19482/m.49910 type:complete len:240 (+) Transcript_19482:92-811(+)